MDTKIRLPALYKSPFSIITEKDIQEAEDEARSALPEHQGVMWRHVQRLRKRHNEQCEIDGHEWPK